MGNQLNPEEWTHCKKLNEPGRLAAGLLAFNDHGRAPTEDEIAATFIPMNDEDLASMLPCAENNWTLTLWPLRKGANSRVVETLRESYQKELESYNKHVALHHFSRVMLIRDSLMTQSPGGTQHHSYE